MLLRFSVSNFISFKDEVSLNMTPVKSRIMKNHIIKDAAGKKIEILPVATIYGANASGKTNLVKAVSFMKSFISYGSKPDQLTGAVPFLLDSLTEKEPSRFEIVFKHENVIYTYGFLVTTEEVREEWLFAYYSSRESCVFERVTKDSKILVKAGNRLLEDVKKADFINFIAQGTRPNQLFLTEAHAKNIQIIQPVMHWFKDHLQVLFPDATYMALALRAHTESNFIQFLSTFLNAADTGISKLSCNAEDFDPIKHLAGFPGDLKEKIMEDLNTGKSRQILIRAPEGIVTIIKEDKGVKTKARFLHLTTEHVRNDGKIVSFETTDESDGTRRLMELLPMLLDIWEIERVFVIDELDRSLHSHLSRLFLQICIDGVAKKNTRGQFIMTTHDTNLLDRSLLRRDEIFFMEKDKNGASHLASLAEYKVSDGLNYENGYLNGRFGAVPFVKDTAELLK